MTGDRAKAWPLVTALLAMSLVSAGCGTGSGQASAAASAVPPPSLATSLVTTGGSAWAVVVMGGSAAQHNNFWQLFARPAASGSWRVVTPAGVASNGGLVLAGLGAGSVIAGFRPSQGLSYSPLATSRNNGAAWTPSILDAGLADVPDALAASPVSGRLLALLTTGETELSSPGGTAWVRLATRRSLAGITAAKACGPSGPTAVAFSPSGVPLLATGCAHPGTAGIFAYRSGTWHATGPAMPAAYVHGNVTVLRLATVASTTEAVLAVGAGPAARLVVASSGDGGGHWALSPPLRPGGARVRSASFGAGGTVAVVLAGNRALTISGTAGPWVSLPALPPGTATLAPGPAGKGWDALAAHGSRLTVWRLAPGGHAWATAQAVNVRIEYGSSS
jgi:hypothetical protein